MSVTSPPTNGNGNLPRVQAKGAPLAPWPKGKPVPISAMDIDRALAEWDDSVPEAAGLLRAPVWDVAQDGPEPRRPTRGFKGGPGSGNFGHAGRPGHVGGSASGESGEHTAVGKSGTNHEISEFLNLKHAGVLAGALVKASSVISVVHSVPPLRRLPVVEDWRIGGQGEFRLDKNGKASSLRMATDAEYPLSVSIHEIGHYLDMSLGVPQGDEDQEGRSIWTLERPRLSNSAAGRGVMDAIDRSRASKELYADLKANPVYVDMGDGTKRLFTPPKKFVIYMRSNPEQFARAYMQWIAIRSGDSQALAELHTKRRRQFHDDRGRPVPVTYPMQWEDDDFTPIAAELDKLFSGLGLLKAAP